MADILEIEDGGKGRQLEKRRSRKEREVLGRRDGAVGKE